MEKLTVSRTCTLDTADTDALAQCRTQILGLQQQLDKESGARIAAQQQVSDLRKERDTLAGSRDAALADLKRSLQLVEEVQKREAVWRAKLEKIRDTNDLLAADQQHWHKRESRLAKTFLKLEDEHLALLDMFKKDRAAKVCCIWAKLTLRGRASTLRSRSSSSLLPWQVCSLFRAGAS